MNPLWATIFAEFTDVLMDTMVFWLPIILFAIAARAWQHYVAESFVADIKWSIIEVRIPRDILKSPLAMEVFLSNALYQATSQSWMDRWWTGEQRLWSSLEIVSVEGAVHFIMRVPTSFKDLVESQLYAQYPQVEISEVDDYVFNVPPLTKDSGWDAWGCEYTLEKPDPLPIKTYTDYGLDKDPKEENKVDPMTSTIEFLGSIGRGEQVWIQIGVRATEKKYHTHGKPFGKHEWLEEVESYLEERFKEYTFKDEESGRTEMKVPKVLEDEVTAVRRKVAKLAFDCVIRCVYVARKENFNSNNRKSLRMLFRQYNTPVYNGFKRVNSTQFDYKWQERGGRLLGFKEQMMNYYRERVFFHAPMRSKLKPNVFVLNTEELASVYHFPGRVSETPTFKRTDSKTAQSPWNLPV